MRTLNQLKRDEHGIVSGLRGDGALQQRLMEMGICDGVEVSVTRFAPMGDPMEIRVRDCALALRKSEASLVELQS